MGRKNITKPLDFVISGIIGTFVMGVYIVKYGHVEVGPFWAATNSIGVLINGYGGPYFLIILFRFIRR